MQDCLRLWDTEQDRAPDASHEYSAVKKILDKLKKCWEWSKEHWGWLLLGVVSVLLVVTVWNLWTLPPEGGATQQNAAVTASSPTGMKQLQARMWTNRSIVGPHEDIQLKVWFEDSTNEKLPFIEIVDVQEPGFWFVPLYLNATGSDKSRLEVAGPIKLSPSTNHGKYRVTVRYRVTDAQGQVHEGAISSGPITIRDERVEKRQLRSRRLIALFKDLTLPLVLAGMGFWFQRWQGRRDEELKRKESKEARRREKKEAAEASRQEIWKTILPQFYSLSEEHYLPIVRSLRTLERFRLKEAAKANPEQFDRLLFEFLYLVLRMDVLRRKRGQFYFKSRRGELLISRAWSVLAIGNESYLGRATIDAAIEKITLDTTYKQFQYLLATSAPIREIRQKFETWNKLGDPDREFYRYTDLARIMQETLYFESNRPFDKDWYEIAAEFDMKAADDGTGSDPDAYKFPLPPTTDDAETQAKKLKRIEQLKKTLTSYTQEVNEYLTTLPKLDI